MLLIPTLLCPKSWEGMSGNETQRFCSYCKKHVHNLEALSVTERLALLSSPAASICSRYQVAIRRPVKGKEEAYHRHLLKHGAGVVLVGSVLVTLREMHGQAEKQRYYRAASAAHAIGRCEMPGELYCEHRAVIMGMMEIAPPPPAVIDPVNPTSPPPSLIDLKLDPVEVDRLFDQIKPVNLKLKLIDPLKQQ